MTDLTVHHLEYSRSHRVLWLLEELNTPYRMKRYARDAKTFLAPPELKAVHPLGKSPVITDDDLTLAESGAILQYLAERQPEAGLTLGPKDPGYADYLYWIHAAEGSLMPWLVMKLVFMRVRTSPMPFFFRPVARKIADGVIGRMIQPQINTHLDVIEAWLKDRDWFAGDRLTLADIQMSFPLEAASSRVDLSEYSGIRRYLERIRERPAYQTAQEKGGPVTR